jgi:UDP-N-acetylglucosamine--N-acetylmuramyl-(pentapeptide) pyrophosphoryl-undecaprenol N-acetylglucosamine transferase
LEGKRAGVRLVIAGGGTGGHVLPAIAVVDELRRRSALSDLLWIGSHDGVERDAAAGAGIPFSAIPTGKLRRYLSLQNLTDAGRIPLGIAAARRALGRFRSDVILSTGGFVSVPTVLAAKGIAPVLTHEQTAILGLATRINARFADVVAVSFDATSAEASRIHHHVIVTGNPVRAGLRDGDRTRGLRLLGFEADTPVVYVTGGARGASPLNDRVAGMLPDILRDAQIVHQTGPASANADAASLARWREELPRELRSRYNVVEFIRDELPDIYAATDIVVGRAGAGTVAELAFVGLPAILVPLPGTGGDEQMRNAQAMAVAGAAVVMPQHEATPDRLAGQIRDLVSDRPRLAQMGAAAKAVSRPDAAARLADALLELAETGRTNRR